MRPAQHVGCLSRQSLAYVATERRAKAPSQLHTCISTGGCWGCPVPLCLSCPCVPVSAFSCHLLCLSADGLFDIMAPSFGHVDLHLERAKAGVRRR